MIGIDTNVLVRHFTADDPIQTRHARKFLRTLSPARPGFVSVLVMIELYWVLCRGRSRVTPTAVHDLVDAMLDAPELEIEDEEAVDRALRAARSGADFADALIGDTAELFGCSETVTFDRRAAEHLGWRVLR